MSRGRFAPSPTGTLHVGNLRTALAAWLIARHENGEFIVRFEDLDTATARPEFEASQAADLARIGVDFDGEPSRQSERQGSYNDVIADLGRAGLTYTCWCSRREIREAATAPHGRASKYPGTCRDLTVAQITDRQRSGRSPALRLRSTRVPYEIIDEVQGPVSETIDDFVLRRGDGTPAYNLAVVIDDAAQGIDQVVRGDDLLESTPRQAYLYDLLGLSKPRWIHVPLVLGADGQRLAKRHGAVTLEDRLSLGDTAPRVVAVLARSLGLAVPETEITTADLLQRFRPNQINNSPWTLPSQLTNQAW